jgi:hypothetical protein
VEQLYVLDGDPPEDDLTPPLLGASYYLETGDFLGLLECLALLVHLVAHSPSPELLQADEAEVLRRIEQFHVNELVTMHQTLVSSELATSAAFHDMAGVHACCRAAEFRQRARLLEVLNAIRPARGWTLRAEWEAVQISGHRLFQASAIFVAWLHQRFALHYWSRDPRQGHCTLPHENTAIWPYTLRALAQGPAPIIRRTRLAGWRADDARQGTVHATLLVVPALRNPATMLEALRACRSACSGPFHRKPAHAQGVFITELGFEPDR